MTKTNRTPLFSHIKKKVTKKYLKQISKDHLENHHQLASFSFDYLSRTIAVEGRYELKELNELKAKFADKLASKAVVDVGANIGNHSTFFSSFAKSVFAFEPNPVVFKLLDVNTRNAENITIFNFGCSDKTQTLKAVVRESNWGAGSVSNLNDHSAKHEKMSRFNYELKPLDEVYPVNEEAVGLIKIDVEGHELSALKGMKSILQKQKPVVVFEQNDGIVDGTSREIMFLRELGYNNLFVMNKIQDWFVPAIRPSFIKNILRAFEVLLLGYPPEKLELTPVAFLDKKSYGMIIMTQDETATSQVSCI